MSPLCFSPIYMERVWGGRSLETLFGRELPQPDRPYGESWEISDRPEAESVICGGPLDGESLSALWKERREELFGTGYETCDRFPLLIKILDACDDLSIQVHPPAAVAPSLGGEPKTEMWFIAEAKPGARLFVGLKRGVSREAFENAIANGEVADLVHAIEPQKGDSIFIPSGRLHAIGAGLVIFEIQQNSDTTYRVFDWNRTGLDGRPRPLHVEASLRCIDFDDCEPGMDVADGARLASCPHFEVSREEWAEGETVESPDAERFSILAVVTGSLRDDLGRAHGPGTFLLIPRNGFAPRAEQDSALLRVTLPPTTDGGGGGKRF